jgi:phosphatidylglycerol:prolipoprotein diacylglycerol transferase
MISVNPDKYAFIIPFVDHPVAWYGILFALGFFVSYFIVKLGLKERLEFFGEGTVKNAELLTDKLTVYIVIGSIIGARIFEVFIYSWPYYKSHPFEIIKIWKGGLASHGGAFGVLVAISLFIFFNKKRYYKTLSFLSVLDFVTIGGAFTGTLIRIGNFINQEIVGKVSYGFWSVKFLHPQDNLPPLPRHPVQLYESFVYLMSFMALMFFWRRQKNNFYEGKIAGLFFILVFGSRFFLEPLKEDPSELILSQSFSMGQLLSIPFIILGICLVIRKQKALSKNII